MSWSDQDIDQLFKGAKAPEPPPFEEVFWTEMEALLPDNTAAWKDEDIDRLFREAEAPVPALQEAFWTEMETMLPEQKRRRVAVLWWISGAAVFVALLGISGFWFFGSQDSAGANASAAAGKPARPATHSSGTTNVKSQFYVEPAEEAASSAAEAVSRTEVSRPQPVQNGSPVHVNGTQKGSSAEIIPAEPQLPGMIQQTEYSEQPEEIGSLDVTAFSDGLANSLVKRSLPKITQKRAAERFYAQASAGIGQSSQRNVNNASAMLHYYTIGGGLFKRVDNMVLTFGVNARVDFTQNVIGSTGFGEPYRTDTKYNEFYSVETPASIGVNAGRNTFSLMIAPGFQTGFSGRVSDFENNVEVRSERTSGKVENGRTLTMEIGFGYWRTLQPNWYLGASINADALRPFNPSGFAGDPRLLPLNGQVTLRRTF
jgi:hypothetical protein